MRDLATIKKLIESTEKSFGEFGKQAQEGFDYYNNKSKIKTTGAAAIADINAYLRVKGSNPLRSADNRVGLNLHMIVVDQKTGYLFSNPPAFDMDKNSSQNGDKELLKRVNDTVGDQWGEVIKQLGTDAANTGRGWLAYWVDDKGFDYWYVNPLTIRPIYDNSTVKRKLKMLIRAYAYTDDAGESVTRFEIWDDEEVAYLIKNTSKTDQTAIDFELNDTGECNIIPHTYGRIPFIEFRNNAKAHNDLAMYKDLIDAIDKLISGFCNDVDDLQEIIWVLKNYAGETSETDYDADGKEIDKTIDLLQMLKARKWVSVDDKGGLDAVRGEIPHEARTKLFELLDKAFWQAAMAVDPSPDRVGNQSGVYISFLYGLLEQKSSLTETLFRTAIGEFLDAILNHLGIKDKKQFVQTWKRTKPQNDVEVTDILNSTPNTVMSDATKTMLHPFIDDHESERKQIEKENEARAENMLDQYAEVVPPKEGDE